MKTSALIVACNLICCALSAQSVEIDETTLTPDSASQSRLKLGFLIGINYSTFYSSSSTHHEEQTVHGKGVRLGLQAGYELNQHFELVARTEMVFNKSKLKVTDNESITYTSTISPVNMQLSGNLKFKLPIENWEPYVLAGPNARVPIESENKPQRIYRNKSDVAFDLGLGLSHKFPNVTISPEIRYTYGNMNINTNPYLNSVTHHQFCFVISFTG
jgi:hypothetical protein